MRKIISIFLCLSFLSLNATFAQPFKDNLAESLNKSLKIEKATYRPIEDTFVLKTLNKNLKIQKENPVYYKDDFALKTLNPNLKIQKEKQDAITDKIGENKIKISPRYYYTTKKNLSEGKYIDFVLVEDVKINNVSFKKGAIIKARVETLSQNAAYGVPADLVVGNFTMPNNFILEGQISRQGANRALWVYPTGYLLTSLFLIGLPIFAIRGGHAKLNPHKVYEIEI